MSLFAIQSLVGGFLDEDLNHFNKYFDDWCIQFDNYDDAVIIAQTLQEPESVVVVEITPLSYPKYFFPKLQGTVYLTRQVENKIVCAIEPYIGSNFKIAICDIETKDVRVPKTTYKTVTSAEAAFVNFI